MSHPLRFTLPTLGLSALSLVAPGCAAEPVSYETFEEACAAVPGCGESRYPIEGNLEPVFRVLVVRSAEGAFSIAQSERIELVEGDGIPLGPSGGDVLLAGRNASGEPVDGQLIRFPTTRLWESLGEDAFSEEQSLEGEATSAIGYVRALPDVTELALLDLEGNAIAQAPLPVAPPEEEGVSREALLIATTSPACAHVRILNGEADRAWAETDSLQFFPPGPLQRALIDATLSRMTPALCKGIHRIALVNLDPTSTSRGEVWTGTTGDLVYLNIGYREAGIRVLMEEALVVNPPMRVVFQRVFAHEVGHTFEALLNAEGGRPRTRGAWDQSARSLAADTIDHARIREGLGLHWSALHEGFVQVGMADVYEFTDARRAYTPEQIATAGAISGYGSTSRGDDIAESIAWLVTGPLFDAAGITSDVYRSDDGCQRMRTYTEGGVPGRYAALYTKLRFLRDLGAVSAEDVALCTGPGLGLRDEGDDGFEFSQDGVPGRSFIADTDSRIENDMYEFGATGGISFGEENFRARARLRLNMPTLFMLPDGEERPKLPRGIYQLSLATSDDFRVVVQDEPAASFVVSDGFVLIASATNERVVGSIFVREGFRYDAPFPVPQVFDPPLIISFIDNMPPQ